MFVTPRAVTAPSLWQVFTFELYVLMLVRQCFQKYTSICYIAGGKKSPTL